MESYNDVTKKAITPGALLLATQGLEDYPDQRTSLDYWRMTMAARTGDPAQSMKVLREALEHGQWYSELLLRRSPSFKPLQGDPDFEQLVALEPGSSGKGYPKNLPDLDPAPRKPLPQRRPDLPAAAGPAHQCRYGSQLVGLLAVRQRLRVGWWLRRKARRQSGKTPMSGTTVRPLKSEIQKHYATLQQSYAIDPQRTILAGHSMGG